MSAPAKRVACLAFDAPGTFFLEQGLEAGRLPTLAGLLERGRPVALADRQEICTPATWPTMLFGADLPDHGIFADRMYAPGEYRVRDVLPEDGLRVPFWRHLEAAGVRSIVLSAYCAPLFEPFDGLQVGGWGSHDPFNAKLRRFQSQPPELIAELDELVGERTLGFHADPPISTRQLRSYIDERVRGCAQQSRALIHLLGKGDWRFAFASFPDCHQAGHWLWHLADPSHPDHDPDQPADVRDGLMRIYEATDRAIGEVIETLPPDTLTLIVSPYDMGQNHHFDEAFLTVLERGGWLVRNPPQRAGARVRMLRAGRRAVRVAVPPALRPALGRATGRDRLLAELAVAEYDWARTRVLPVPSDGSSAIRLNLAGRDPAGVVQPGAEAERELAEIAECLAELRCADSGEPVVARMMRYEELFDAAPYSGTAELFVQWARLPRPSAIRSERVGEIPVPAMRSIRSVHRAPGFAIGAGPGIEPAGERSLRYGAQAGLRDVAATVLAQLGVPVPPEITGRPIEGLVPAAAAAADRA